MKILLINYEYPPLGGGAGNATRHLAGELSELGHQVTVLTSGFAGLSRQECVEGFRITRIPTLRRHLDRCSVLEMAVFLFASVFAAVRHAWADRPDVTCAFFGLPCGPAALAVNKLFGVPYVVSLRGGDVPGFQPYDLAVYHALARPVITAIWRHASSVVANSRGLKRLAEVSAGGVPIELIPNGV
jgi:glycosyltransferase involved in cell wall biosynthesis